MLEGVQFEPGNEVWPNIRQAIEPERRRRRFVFWWILPVILAGGTGIYFMNRSSVPTAAVAEKTGPATREEFGKRGIEKQDTEKITEINTGATSKPDIVDIEKTEPIHLAVTLRKHPRHENRVLVEKENDRSTAPGELPVMITANTQDTARAQSLTETGKSVAGDIATSEKATNAVVIAPGHPPAFEDNIMATDSVAAKPAVGMDKPVVVTKIHRWKFGISAELGIARLAGGFGGQKEFMTATPSTGSSVPSVIYKRQHYGSNLLWGTGLVAERQISSNVAFQGGIGYQFRSFSLTNSSYKDSMVSGSWTTYPVSNEQNNFRFHSMNISAGILFPVLNQKYFGLSAGAALDNQVIIAARNNKATVVPATSFSADEKRSVLGSYHRWQPQLKLQFQAGFHTTRQHSLQFTPYLRYGFRSLEKQAGKERTHLLSYGVGVNYFFR